MPLIQTKQSLFKSKPNTNPKLPFIRTMGYLNLKILAKKGITNLQVVPREINLSHLLWCELKDEKMQNLDEAEREFLQNFKRK